MLMIGLGAQRVAWPRPLFERLAAKDRFVIASDNRDLQTLFDDQ